MTERQEEPHLVRLAIAAIAACTSAAFLYAAMRIVQSLVLKEPDPALVFYSEHSGYFWRSWTVVYAGGMLGFIAWLAAGRDARRTTRVLATSVIVSTLLVLIQGILVP